LNVTVDVHNVGELNGLSAIQGLSTHGIDSVQIDPVSQADLHSLLSETSSLTRDLASIRSDNLTIDTINMSSVSINSVAHISAADVQTLVIDGLHFASHNFVNLDVSAGQAVQATHLSTSLHDLSKLGIDTLSVSDHSLDGSHIGDLSDLVSSIKDAGLEHLGLFTSDLQAADGLLLAKVESFDWVNSGVDFSLQVDAPNANLSQPQNLDQLVNFVQDGVDVLSGVGLSVGSNWGDLINVLHESGLGNVELESNASVTISDDLSAALYESGMLHSLPDANIQIDVGSNTVLNTSLKAMADIGVDRISSDHKVYVELGIKPEDLSTVADLGDLFSAFGLDHAGPHELFNGQQAGLVIDQTTFSNLSEANIESLVGHLSKLGFTEIDVVGASANDGAHVYAIDAPVAQTPVLSTVEILGSNNLGELAHVFDPDILHKNVK
jgi:hypothetical protein